MIHQIEDLDHMLLFAFRSRRDSPDIVKIHPPFHAGLRSFFWLRYTGLGMMNPLMLGEDLPNGARGVRQPDSCLLDASILV
jgi:hypothetical protein